MANTNAGDWKSYTACIRQIILIQDSKLRRPTEKRNASRSIRQLKKVLERSDCNLTKAMLPGQLSAAAAAAASAATYSSIINSVCWHSFHHHAHITPLHPFQQHVYAAYYMNIRALIPFIQTLALYKSYTYLLFFTYILYSDQRKMLKNIEETKNDNCHHGAEYCSLIANGTYVGVWSVGRQGEGRRPPTFFQGGNAFPHYFTKIYVKEDSQFRLLTYWNI